MNEPTQQYLGDGLYASFDGFQVEVFSHDGLNKTNSVFMEPDILDSFIGFIKSIKQKESL
jgi:hypothetical protein